MLEKSPFVQVPVWPLGGDKDLNYIHQLIHDGCCVENGQRTSGSTCFKRYVLWLKYWENMSLHLKCQSEFDALV